MQFNVKEVHLYLFGWVSYPVLKITLKTICVWTTGSQLIFHSSDLPFFGESLALCSCHNLGKSTEAVLCPCESHDLECAVSVLSICQVDSITWKQHFVTSLRLILCLLALIYEVAKNPGIFKKKEALL